MASANNIHPFDRSSCIPSSAAWDNSKGPNCSVKITVTCKTDSGATVQKISVCYKIFEVAAEIHFGFGPVWTNLQLINFVASKSYLFKLRLFFEELSAAGKMLFENFST